MHQTEKVSNPFQYTIAGLFLLLVCRLLAMVFIPLNDTTEARYAEIARKMLDTGNWITPLHDYGIPFWAKPPLSTWLSALSMKLFGVNEFAARLPSMLLSLGVLLLVWQVAKCRSGKKVAWNAVSVLAASAFFLLDAGTVMTDPALLFCVTLGMVSFRMAVVEDKPAWRYLFFAGLGLGLLAKGPIAVVLTGMPLFVWVLVYNKWRMVWCKLPWISGILLMLAISLPWYYLAEQRTPGFLDYFIVGEHLGRFLKSSWQGDKYGYAHAAPLGMIWVYALAGILPWTVSVFFWLIRHGRSLPAACRGKNGWVIYLLLFTLLPLLFFTFAKNIIYPYVFPCLPAFALLYAELAESTALTNYVASRFVWLAGLMACLFLTGTVLFLVLPQSVAKSQKYVIAAWEQQNPAPGSKLVYWTDKTEFSAQFYSRGLVLATKNRAELCQLLSNYLQNYVVINSKEATVFPPDLLPYLSKVKSIRVLKNTMTLYREEGLHC